MFDLAIGRPPAHVDNLGIEASRSYTGLQLDAKERDRLMIERENERDALATERHQQLMGQSEKQGQCLMMLCRVIPGASCPLHTSGCGPD